MGENTKMKTIKQINESTQIVIKENGISIIQKGLFENFDSVYLSFEDLNELNQFIIQK